MVIFHLCQHALRYALMMHSLHLMLFERMMSMLKGVRGSGKCEGYKGDRRKGCGAHDSTHRQTNAPIGSQHLLLTVAWPLHLPLLAANPTL